MYSRTCQLLDNPHIAPYSPEIWHKVDQCSVRCDLLNVDWHHGTEGMCQEAVWLENLSDWKIMLCEYCYSCYSIINVFCVLFIWIRSIINCSPLSEWSLLKCLWWMCKIWDVVTFLWQSFWLMEDCSHVYRLFHTCKPLRQLIAKAWAQFHPHCLCVSIIPYEAHNINLWK